MRYTEKTNNKTGAWDPVNKVSRLQLQGRLLYKPYGCTGRHPKMPGLGLYKG